MRCSGGASGSSRASRGGSWRRSPWRAGRSARPPPCRAAGLGADGFAALALLRAHNLVRGTGPDGARRGRGLSRPHPRDGDAAAPRPEDRIAWHRLLARELEDAGGADPETLAIHFEAAGEPREGRAILRAGGRRRGRGPRLRPRREALPPRPRTPAPRRRRGPAAPGPARRGPGQRRPGLRGGASLPGGRRRGRRGRASTSCRRGAAYQFLISGHIDEGQAAFREVLDACRPPPPRHAEPGPDAAS